MAGRYVHMFMSNPTASGESAVQGMGAYLHEDGTYTMALQLQRGTRPPANAAAWQATLQDALPSAPKVQLASKMSTI